MMLWKPAFEYCGGLKRSEWDQSGTKIGRMGALNHPSRGPLHDYVVLAAVVEEIIYFLGHFGRYTFDFFQIFDTGP